MLQAESAIASASTSHAVRVGVAALLVVFYIDGLLRDGGWFSWIVFGVLIIPAALGLLVTTRGIPAATRPRLVDIALALPATLLVGIGVRELGLTPVLAASLVGVAAALVARSHASLGFVAVPLYCGAFAGMTSEEVLADWVTLALAGILAGVLVSLLRATWDGVGGKLGLLAFGGVFATSIVARLTGRIGEGAQLLDLDRADRIALVLVPVLAAAVTWELRQRGVSPVMSSAAPTALFVLTLALLDDATPLGDLMAFAYLPLCIAWFGGSFIGMTSPGRSGGRLWPLLVAGALFGVLQIGFKPAIVGFGGDFGASSTVAVLAVLGATAVIDRRRG